MPELKSVFCFDVFPYAIMYFVVFCICVFVYLYAERRAPVKGVDYTKAGGERGSRAL